MVHSSITFLVVDKSVLKVFKSLLLIPIALIYKVIPNTYTLLALQSIALGILPAIAWQEATKETRCIQVAADDALFLRYGQNE